MAKVLLCSADYDVKYWLMNGGSIVSNVEDVTQLHNFAQGYDNYPDLASNIALDAQEAGEPTSVINFFEVLGDTYLEDKDQVISMIDQIEETDTNQAM